MSALCMLAAMVVRRVGLVAITLGFALLVLGGALPAQGKSLLPT